jgi:hypothetical protein
MSHQRQGTEIALCINGFSLAYDLDSLDSLVTDFGIDYIEYSSMK